jgi:hypothetical protein
VARIYLSSTSRDLVEYRHAASETLRKSGHDVVDLDMSDRPDVVPTSSTLSDVAASDLFIVIAGWLYGYIPTENNPERVSVTELEYRYAVSLGKPRLIFLLERLPVSSGSNRDEMDRARAFRERLEQDTFVGRFSNVPDFVERLTAAVLTWQRSWLPPDAEVGVEYLPLLWRLVADFKGGLDLLRHPEPGAFAIAIAKWEEANNATPTTSWSERVDRARKDLESRQSSQKPSELWLAWMKAVRTSPITTQPPSPAKASSPADTHGGPQ